MVLAAGKGLRVGVVGRGVNGQRHGAGGIARFEQVSRVAPAQIGWEEWSKNDFFPQNLHFYGNTGNLPRQNRHFFPLVTHFLRQVTPHF